MAATERIFDTSTPAVVLKLAPNVMHHGGLGAIRSLGRVGVPVYAVHERMRAPAATSRYLAGRFIWNPDASDLDQVTAGLLFMSERIGRPAVLFATDDVGSLYLAEHGSELRSRFLFPDPPVGLPRRLADKHSLYEVCREMGLSAPQVCLPDSISEARMFALSTGYPVIAKLTSPWLSGGRVPTTSLLRDEEGLADLYRECKQFNVRLMLQEFIPGGSGHDWFFHGYCDAFSICRPAFTGIKVRSLPLGAGGTTFGRSAANDKLREQVTELLTRLKYRGLLDLDIRLDARDGQYNLLDFNPRVGAQFRIFRDTAGIDVILAAYLDLTGQAIPAGEQLQDRTFMAESYDPLSVLAHLRRGELTPGRWLSEIRSLDEPAWFARDDLRPFGLMCARMAWKTASRSLPGIRRESSSGSSHETRIQYRVGRAKLARGRS